MENYFERAVSVPNVVVRIRVHLIEIQLAKRSATSTDQTRILIVVPLI